MSTIIFEVRRQKYQDHIETTTFSIGLFTKKSAAQDQLKKSHDTMLIFADKQRGNITNIKNDSFHVSYADIDRREICRQYIIVERTLHD